MRVPEFTYKITHNPDKFGYTETQIQADSAVEAIRLFATRQYTVTNNLDLIDIAKVENEDDRFHRLCMSELADGTLSTLGD